jgi:hypothetical protein
MTVSNFDWTDKTSLKWFIMLPTGHEGPYNLDSIEQSCHQGVLSLEIKIWAEGIQQPITVREALGHAKLTPINEFSYEDTEFVIDEDFDELPPLPEEEEIPPIPLTFKETAEEAAPDSKRHFGYYILGGSILVGLVLFLLVQWIKGNENISIRRHSKMDLELQQRIESELSFESWDQKLFFREYVPVDLSFIWLVTASFHKCEIEAEFQSIAGKLIAPKDENIAFKSLGKLSNHIVELSSFDFRSGNKVLPGMYELDIKATRCEWDGFAAKLANLFRPSEQEYSAQMKVILYPKGASEFNEVLSALIKKKSEQELRDRNREEMFWQDLQQKLQTLLAISLQIEQHLIDFMQSNVKRYAQNLIPAVDIYTKKFGHFLTNFVESNEEYFKQLDHLGERSRKRNYELLLNLTSKKIGYESMKIIEELQKFKKPDRKKLNELQSRLKKKFAELKNEINQKIIQISEDRSS